MKKIKFKERIKDAVHDKVKIFSERNVKLVVILSWMFMFISCVVFWTFLVWIF